jgi:transposase
VTQICWTVLRRLETVVVRERKRHATPAERAAAVALYRSSGRSAASVAAEVGVHVRTLETWIRDARRAEIDPDGSMTEEQVRELLRLRKENAALQREVEFWKKAEAFFRERDHGSSGTR